MPTVTLNTTAIHNVSAYETAYTDARAGQGAVANGLLWTGQYFSGSQYEVSQNFLTFNTSTIPIGTITGATLVLTVVENYGSNTVEVRQHTFTTTGTTSAFIPGASLASKNLLGTATISGGYSADFEIPVEIVRSSSFQVALTTADQRTATLPDPDDTFRITGASLIVDYIEATVLTTPGSGSITAPAWARSGLVEVWGGGQAGLFDSGSSSYSGGGGGAYARKNLTVTGGQTFSYSIASVQPAQSSSQTHPSTAARYHAQAQSSWFGSASTVFAEGGGYSDTTGFSGVNFGGRATASIGDVVYSGGPGSVSGGGGGSAYPNGHGGGGSLSGGSSGSTPGGVWTTNTTGDPSGVSNVEGGSGAGTRSAAGGVGAPGGAPGGGGGACQQSGPAGAGSRGQIRITWSDGRLVPLSLSPNTVQDTASTSATVGTLQGTAPGSTFSLVDNDGGRFIVSSTTGQVFVNASLIGFAGERTIVVRETNGAAPNSPRDSAVTIIVTAPTLQNLSVSPNQITHTARVGTTVGMIMGNTGQSTISLVDDDGGRFAISWPNIIVAAPLNSVVETTRSVTLREERPGAPNSPRDTTTSISVTRGFEGPLYVGAGGSNSSTAGITIGMPSGILAGDRLFIVTETANQAVATPTGWTSIYDQGVQTPGSTSATRLIVFTKVAGSSEANVALADPGDHIIARAFAFGPCEIEAQASFVSSVATTAGTVPTVSASGNNRMLFVACSQMIDNASGRVTFGANSNLTNKTTVSNIGTTQGNGGGFGVMTGEMRSSATSGTTPITFASSTNYSVVALALVGPNPEPEPPPATRKAPRSGSIH